MNNRYVCLHGHFFQPPRQNPWLEEVEQQDSAYPYHDWNEKITWECYAPNAASRILDANMRIVDIMNNYRQISFDFGPTLLTWLESHFPKVYARILEADARSQQLFCGHGSAIAQAYNHIIMPMATRTDKQTQVLWGIADFEHRFKRYPEGMWTAQTAIDYETLEIMAEQNIRFTILDPNQAHAIRPIGQNQWQKVDIETFNTGMPYRCVLPSGRSIDIFFYDAGLAQDMRPGRLLNSGEELANSICARFDGKDTAPHLVHASVNGETFGHHHRKGDMALAYCLYHITTTKSAKLTVYGEFLEKFPPTFEVQIREKSSWTYDQELSQNPQPDISGHDFNPLQGATDWLRDNLQRIYTENMQQFTPSPWAVRDNYVSLMLDRSEGNQEVFFAHNFSKNLDDTERVFVLKLLEMQRCAMLMYSSSIINVEEIAQIENQQNLLFASRAISLAKQVSGLNLEQAYIKLLERVKSSHPELANGAAVYETFVQPSVIDSTRLCAHYAITSLFGQYPEESRIYSYTVTKKYFEQVISGTHKLLLGTAHVKSELTQEADDVSFAVLYFGEFNISAGVRIFQSKEKFENMISELKTAFANNDTAEVILLINSIFESNNYSLWHLFKDEQRRILEQLFTDTFRENENTFRMVNQRNLPLMVMMKDLRMPIPRAFALTAELVANSDLRQAVEADPVNPQALSEITKRAREWSFDIETVSLEFLVRKKIDTLMEALQENPFEQGLLQQIISVLESMAQLGINVDLWSSQNIYFELGKKHYLKKTGTSPTPPGKDWAQNFNRLGELLKVRMT